MTVAAPAPIRPHGCRTGARPRAYHGDILSTCACHFGGFFGFFGCPLLRRCRIAIAIRTTPMAIFTATPASEGAVSGLGGLLPVASTVTETTITRDASHPNTKAAPFLTPRLEGSTTRNAINGSGSSATATPIRRRLSTTAGLPSHPSAAAAAYIRVLTAVPPVPRWNLLTHWTGLTDG